jgi:hypothetical protein
MKMRAIETSLVLALAVPLAFGACRPMDDEADEFRSGVTRHEDVAMAFPGAAQQGALTAEGGVQGALLGEKSEFYTLTRGITDNVNGATWLVLTLVKTITEYPPSTIDGDTAVWGPHMEPLKPNAWRLTVHRLAPGQFEYRLDAKDKTLGDDAFVTLLAGHHNVAGSGLGPRRNGPGYGSGDFVLDWNAGQTLPEHDDNVGKSSFTYSHVSPAADVIVSVTFEKVKDDEVPGALVDATYDYVATPSDGGNFQFTISKDAIPTTTAIETLSVRSRWQQTGAGRSDVKYQGGDLATPATANECWDASYASVFLTNSYGDPAKMWGAESACVFPTADYAQL